MRIPLLLAPLAVHLLVACHSAPDDWTTAPVETKAVTLGAVSATVRVPADLHEDSALTDPKEGTVAFASGFSGVHLAYQVSPTLVPPANLDEAAQYAKLGKNDRVVKKTTFRRGTGSLVATRSDDMLTVQVFWRLKTGGVYRCVADYSTSIGSSEKRIDDASATKYLTWLEGLCSSFEPQS